MVTREAQKCSDCALAKSRKKNIPKEAKKFQVIGECVCMNISSIKVVSQGGKKFWALKIDKHSKMLWSFILKCKSDLTLVMTPHLQEMKTKDGYDPHYL